MVATEVAEMTVMAEVADTAHGVDDAADEVHGSRTRIASRIDQGELGQAVRVADTP